MSDGSMHAAFNRSWLSRFLNSTAGRVFRVLAGTGFIAVGLVYRDHALGLASMAWGVLPLTAGGFDVCYVSAALGGPIRGAAIRALQR